MHRNNARSGEEHDGEEGYLFVFNFFLVFACAAQNVGSYFQDQVSNLSPLHWNYSLNHCITREIPVGLF